ncbi:hypothetical protein KIPB_016992, partial [Kipferlia bialata]|eukprot:g16992.t1
MVVVAGKGIETPLAIVTILTNFFFLVPYIVVVGDYVQSFVPSAPLTLCKVVGSCFTMLPLSLFPDLRRL